MWRSCLVPCVVFLLSFDTHACDSEFVAELDANSRNQKSARTSLASRDGKFLIAIERQTLFLYEICTTSKKPLADDPAAEVNFRDQNDTDPFQGHTASPMVTASM